MTDTITIRVNPDKCQGHARCSALAPALFRLDEFGYAQHSIEGCIPPESVEKAYVARANCPEEAIMIESASAAEDHSASR
jgi:ferredoxin